jgi:hypothetical protein
VFGDRAITSALGSAAYFMFEKKKKTVRPILHEFPSDIYSKFLMKIFLPNE